MLRALIRATLAPHGYEIVEAEDGDDAVERAQLERPDLIIVDMMMPGRSGLDVIAELRGDPELRVIPVVVLTARTQATDRKAVADAGADRFLAKPFSPAELAALVAELVEERR